MSNVSDSERMRQGAQARLMSELKSLQKEKWVNIEVRLVPQV